MEALWWKELGRAAAIAALGLLLGAVVGRPVGFLLLGISVYAAWLLVRLGRLARWLEQPAQAERALPDDIYGEICYRAQRSRAQAQRRERRLKDLVKRYQASAAALPDAVVVLRGDNVIEWMNAAAGRLLGLDMGADIGQRIDNLVRGPAFVAFLHSGGGPLEFAAPHDADRHLLLHIVPYGTDERLLVARDVTEVHRLEVMRRDFVANVSHELSTPLTVIDGYLEALGDRRADAGAAREALGQMRLQTERMKNLVRDLLQVTRLETAEPPAAERAVDVPALLEGVRSEAVALSGAQRHAITLHCDEALWLRGDEQHLHSAFANLARNAVQYTPAGGRIEIRWYADARGAHLEVRDNGIGIAPRDIPRLTERFYRVDAGRSRASGGTGLGLAIVKHVLRNHGAELHIDSTPGGGSIFRCDFPPGRGVARPADAVMKTS